MTLPDDDVLVSLIERIATGDQDAMGSLWDELSPWLHGVLLRMLGDADAAELLTRRTLVEMWRAAPLWDQHVGRPLLWSMAMARSFGVQWLADNRRDHKDVGGDQEASRDDSSQVGSVLASLPERDVLEASWFHQPVGGGIQTPAPEQFGPLIRQFADALAR